MWLLLLLLQAILSKQRAETLSSVLYPDDRTYEGKELRLKQQHFFVSATVQVRPLMCRGNAMLCAVDGLESVRYWCTPDFRLLPNFGAPGFSCLAGALKLRAALPVR